MRSLWRKQDRRWRAYCGFPRNLLRQLHAWNWLWPACKKFRSCNGVDFSVRDLLTARHQFREVIRLAWWRRWAPLRPCLAGTEGGVDRQLSLVPVLAAASGDLRFDDGASGHRYRKLLTDALWSRFRLFQASLVDAPHGIRCGEEEERALHFMWECRANANRRSTLDEARGCNVFHCIPRCLARCGLIPSGCSIDRGKLIALQSYLAHAVRLWCEAREGLESFDETLLVMRPLSPWDCF